MTWTSDELEKIGTADELEISTLREDGSLRKPVTIWVVQAGDGLYVRAVNGRNGKWFQHAEERQQGHINAGGVSKDVIFQNAGDDVKDIVDAAYKSKYNRYGDKIVGSTLTPQAQAATLKFGPLP